MTRSLPLALVVVAALAGRAAAQVPAGPELHVNTYTTLLQASARIAVERDGDFVVTWISYPSQDGSGSGVFAQRYAADGAPRGAEFRVNTFTTGPQQNAMAAMNARGFLVAWVDDLGSPTWAKGIAAQRYEFSGSPSGGEFELADHAGTRENYPSLARVGGGFVVAWGGSSGDGNDYGIVARLLDPSGRPVGAEFVVNTFTTGTQNLPSVAADAAGNFTVVWHSRPTFTSAWEPFGQRFDAAGNRLGGEFAVRSNPTCCPHFPAISAAPDGPFVVAWSSFDYAMHARRFDAAGSPLGPDFVVSTVPASALIARPGAVAHDERGNFVIVWRQNIGTNPPASSIRAQRFDAAGNRRGAELIVKAMPDTSLESAAVASDPVGNLVVAWTQWANTQFTDAEIYARRYGGLFPERLRVDTSRNGVLEPGETADLRPSWRNGNGAAQAFAAGLSLPGGPAGGVPAIVDAAGDYGTVANGVAVECIDCYSVQVPAPSSRPAQHWDGSVFESIVPDALGQQKRWLLHVGGSFADVPPANIFYRFIETVFHSDVMGGCGAGNFCPTIPVPRDHMATFVLSARDLTYVPPDCVPGQEMFADVPASSGYCRWIEELARRGVVTGCGGGNYCPTLSVTRESLAVYVLKTLEGSAYAPPPCGTPIFNDVPASSGFCPWVEELYRRGVVTGCGGGAYCPTLAVARDQMSVFLTMTFALQLYGP